MPTMTMQPDDLPRLRRRLIVTMLMLFFGCLLAVWMESPALASWLALPVSLAGIVGPVFAYQSYQRRGSQSIAPERRMPSYIGAVQTAIGIQQLNAAVGVVVFFLSGALQALIGVAATLLLLGAIWPTEARLELFGSQEDLSE